jgi:hypothetical protein
MGQQEKKGKREKEEQEVRKHNKMQEGMKG